MIVTIHCKRVCMHTQLRELAVQTEVSMTGGGMCNRSID